LITSQDILTILVADRRNDRKAYQRLDLGARAEAAKVHPKNV